MQNGVRFLTVLFANIFRDGCFIAKFADRVDKILIRYIIAQYPPKQKTCRQTYQSSEQITA